MSLCISDLNCKKYCSEKNCHFAKWTSSVIFSALAAIVTIGALLVIVAQAGHSVGSVNALAHLIEPKWAYLILSISVISFACTTAVMIRMRRAPAPKEEIIEIQNSKAVTASALPTLDALLEQACQEAEAKISCQHSGDICLLKPINYKEQSFFALYLKTPRGSELFHWTSEEERVAALKRGGKFYGCSIRNPSLNQLYRFCDQENPTEEKKYKRDMNLEYQSLELIGRYKTEFGRFLYNCTQSEWKYCEDAILSEEYWCLKRRMGIGIYENREIFPLLVCHANDEKEWHFFSNEEARKNFVQFTNYFNGIARHRFYLDQIVLNPGDFYQVKINPHRGMNQLVVYRDSEGVLQRKFKNSQHPLQDDGTFITDKKKELEELKKIGQYPPTLGRYLSSKIDPSLAEIALLPEEYWDFEIQVDRHSAYPEVFPLLIRQADETSKWLYFTKANAREAAKVGLQSGKERHHQAVTAFNKSLSVISHIKPLNIGNGYYRTIDLKGDRTLLLWLDGGGCEHAKYYSKDEIDCQITKLQIKTKI